MQEPDRQPDAWLPLVEAARRLNTSVDALRKQIKRGRREGRRDNHGQWLVKAVQVDNVHGMDGQRVRTRRTRRGVQVDSLVVELAAVRAELSMSKTEVADLRSERDRLLALVEAFSSAERRSAELIATLAARRRWSWPGLRTVWRRVVDGTGAGGS